MTSTSFAIASILGALLGPADRGPAEHGPAEHGPAEHGPAEHGPAEHGPARGGPSGQPGGETHPSSSVGGPDPAPASGETAPSPADGKPRPTNDDALVDAEIIETILPCGLRVMAAKDATLPVAVVVLSIETGGEHDPKQLPGLNHALAFQLLQGNREYPPMGIVNLVHASGGWTGLATGPAQTRFESVVPISILDEIIAAEAARLRAPTVNELRWTETLARAKADVRRGWVLPPSARALLFQIEGLAHDPRQVGSALAELEPEAISRELAQRFTYDRATLVVVAPRAPAQTLAQVGPLFADLPPHAPYVAPGHRVARNELTEATLQGGRAPVLAWSLPASAQPWGRLFCRAINRQPRVQGEPKGARLHCVLDSDARRPTVTMAIVGKPDDELGFARARLARLLGPTGSLLLERERAVVHRSLQRQLSVPLGLARRLAQTRTRSSATVGVVAPVTARELGLEELQASGHTSERLAELFSIERAVLFRPQARGSRSKPQPERSADDPSEATQP